MNASRGLLKKVGINLKSCKNIPNCNFRNYSQEILPKEARVVICGTGIVGNSVAYHLTQNGWTDVVLLEQEGQIGRGTSLFGSGTLALLKPVSEQQIIDKSIALYKKLQADGYDIGLEESGSIYLAQNRERMVLLKRRVALNQAEGLRCKLLTPGEIKEYHPLIYTGDLQGAVYVEEDSVADPAKVCDTLALLAEKNGARYIKNCRYKNLISENGRVSAVDTSLGSIQCQYFVNCAGMWAWEIGERTIPKVRIPVHPAEHFYLKTLPVEDLPEGKLFPVIRDYDSSIYIRKWHDNAFLIGGFEEKAKPIFTKGIPTNWKDLLLPDWDHFAPMLERSLIRVPHLKTCGFDKLINAPDTFTADGRWILGETPEIDNYFVAAGMNGNSLQGAGGIGHSLAMWIINGEPGDTPLIDFDVRRFVDVHNNRRFLYERTKEVVGRQYQILFPLQCEYKYGRRIRCSPLFSTLRAQGAVFGTRMCYERPLYFDMDYKEGESENYPEMPKGSYWKPWFFDSLKEEYQACKEGLAVIDMTSFSKFQISSAHNEALEYLQRLCSNDIDVNEGHISPTGMHNEGGGYENDCMVARQSENSFFIVSPTMQQTRIYDWMEKHLPTDNSVKLSDVTSMYTVLQLIGPKSRELLSQLTDTDLRLHPFTYKTVSLAHSVEVMIMWFTNTGEPGYSLYIPSEYAVHVYDELMRVGKDYGIRNAGYLTLRFLRIEKFIPFWGEEIDSITTPLEIGRNHRVKFNKEYFIGKFAMQKQLEKGIMRRLVHFTLEDDHDSDTDVWPWGNEPVFRNGIYVGKTTSGGFGFTLDRNVCLGFVTNRDMKGNLLPVTPEYINDKNALYQVNLAGRLFNCKPSLHPPKLPVSTPIHEYQPTLRNKSILQAKHQRN